MPEQAHAPAHPVPSQSHGNKARISEALQEARERTWLLADPLTDDQLSQPAMSILSPPNWDLGHIANFEELWLVQKVGDQAELRPGYNDTYNAIRHPRSERPKLKLLDRDGLRTYMEEVRQRALEILQTADTGPEAPPLTRNGFAYWMLILHEHQHQETLLQTINQLPPGAYKPAVVRPLPRPMPGPAKPWVHIPEGPFEVGTAHGPGVYDNEAPPHEVHVKGFEIARFPVTCGEYLAFVRAGGYDDPSLWTDAGRAWLDQEPHHAPLNWFQKDGVWWRRQVTGAAPVSKVSDEILVHVCAHEADAYARWRGCRLPTEVEWEKAARGHADDHCPPRNPWGDALADTQRANVDHLAWGPSRVGSHPAGSSLAGCQHMIGDVWEWTSDGFHPYPGFRMFPYPEYSQVFFGGDFRVLRGGSWATRATCATGTFRNWDLPIRRQIFSGIRLARCDRPTRGA